MSFKREGDDGSQLNLLKKRRVADLLASYIPEDEALLLKNGTYACTVCPHRPVFTTVDMLSVHRKGKKHAAGEYRQEGGGVRWCTIICSPLLQGLQRYYGKKAAHRNEVQKRQHEQYVRAEEAGEQPPAPLLEQTKKITQHALLKAAPYNSCCTRHRPGEVNRKGRISEVTKSPQSRSSLLSPVCTQPAQPETSETSHPEPSSSTGIHRLSKKDGKSKKKIQKSSDKGEDPADGPERKRVMEHYLSLRSSGWIPDGAGNWVKDENVEFDSDEEEPPAIPPP